MSETSKEPRVIRKLRPKDIMESKIKAPEENEGEITLYTILGKANNVRAGDFGYGPFHALKGMFEAERSEDGQRFIAAECFLPEPMHSHLVQQYIDAQEKGEDMP
ncbi:MAG: hypothetical protein GY771_04660, partial [bacterium]|nr:hypothetical protein [bacterium]